MVSNLQFTIDAVTAKHFKDGKVSYVLLIDCAYWHASEWEYELIQKGFHPVELGMHPWTTDSEDD